MVPVHVQLLALMAFNLIYSYCSPPGGHQEFGILNKRTQSNIQRNALPPCGEKCIAKSLSETASCHPADSWCLCHTGPWQLKLEQCFETTCSSPVDMLTSLVANHDFCTKLSPTPTKPPKKPQTNPFKSLPIDSSLQNQTTTAATVAPQSSGAEKPRPNATELFHGVSFRNQTLAPHSPFESTSSALIIFNFHLIYFHLGMFALIFNMTE
ncbi:hypothetical protein PTTG_06086 [Puccinia triticina 1-1 BBBD Race 1]|uniref:CFEM domain-containing protein n=2 Tax=Puccinia triticina TaxID=208348 RepID=A0A180GDK4_PUCT1|nr:uncharacterized protein PtA15_18A355 [Puccinia triticina]OAV90797.1 hypothetical protein PTTG_06086 [Puccinia triticina 1-1 BBBD Race 1]WAQ93295.1 hypothetical protein PtA15_18A355 [Puccinia triticina]WAR63286.1 hypothetical protein PtB15_18B369 [Puccinia triticina]